MYLSYGAHEGALAILERIIDEHPNYVGKAKVLQLRTSMWLRAGRFDDAAKMFRCVSVSALWSLFSRY